MRPRHNEVEIRLIISYHRPWPRNQSPARENVNHCQKHGEVNKSCQISRISPCQILDEPLVLCCVFHQHHTHVRWLLLGHLLHLLLLEHRDELLVLEAAVHELSQLHPTVTIDIQTVEYVRGFLFCRPLCYSLKFYVQNECLLPFQLLPVPTNTS